MSSTNEQSTRRNGYEWLQSPESGSTYICPIGAIRDKSRATEDDFRRYCVDESDNPQNN